MDILLGPYQKAFTVIGQNVDKLPTLRGGKETPSSLAKLTSEEAAKLQYQLNLMQIDYSEMNKIWNYHNPQKRSIPPLAIVGTTLKFLFGTATQEMFEKLNKKTETLQRGEEGLRHNLQEQISIVQSMHNFENETAIIIDNIQNTTINISQEYREISNNVIEIKEFDKKLVNNINFFRRIKFQMFFLKDSLSELITALQLIAAKQLPEFFFSRTKFMNTLKSVQHILPAKYQMIFPVMNVFIHKYYSLLTTRASIERSRLQIIIEIPLRITDLFFDLYKLVPIPIPANKNSSFYVYIEPPHKYPAISQNRLVYIPLEFDDMLQCRIHKKSNHYMSPYRSNKKV